MARPTPRRNLVSDTWLLDILAVVGSFLSLLAIIVLLWTADGKSIFNWHGLAINTIVSIFSAITKLLLAFAVANSLSQWKWVWFTRGSRSLAEFDILDDASRGALWSNIRILWRTKLQ